jgi:hypothetical protein
MEEKRTKRVAERGGGRRVEVEAEEEGEKGGRRTNSLAGREERQEN